jgi:hypothetical protein
MPAPSGFRVYIGYDENWLHRYEGIPPGSAKQKSARPNRILTAD